MRLFLALAALLTAPMLWAAPTLAAHISLNQEAFSALAEGSRKISGPTLSDLEHITRAEIFLLTSQDGVKPVILAQGDAELTKTLTLIGGLCSLKFVQRGEWQVGTPEGFTISTEAWDFYIRATAVARKQPLFAELYPSVIIDFARSNPQFAKQIKDTALDPLLNELATLDRVQLSASRAGNTLRAVLVINTKPQTALRTLLSQRLPTSLPEEHIKLDVSGALGFGYSVYNPQACAKYMSHLSEILKQSSPLTSQQLLNFSEDILSTQGYTAFILKDLKTPETFHWGHWTESTAPDYLQSQGKLALAIAQDIQNHSDNPTPTFSEPQLNEAFRIGDLPVWKLINSGPVEQVGNTAVISEGNEFFFALRRGSLYGASNAEDLTNVIQTVASGTASSPLGRAFVNIPTVNMQMKYDADRALSQISGGMQIEDPAWNTPCPPIYVASSMRSGQLGITWDIPLKIFDKIGILSKHMRASQSASPSQGHHGEN